MNTDAHGFLFNAKTPRRNETANRANHAKLVSRAVFFGSKSIRVNP
jgi:hypothetical protein